MYSEGKKRSRSSQGKDSSCEKHRRGGMGAEGFSTLCVFVCECWCGGACVFVCDMVVTQAALCKHACTCNVEAG